MPIGDMDITSIAILSDPMGTACPTITGIDGEVNPTTLLSKRSYDIIVERKIKAEKHKKCSEKKGELRKLGYIQARAVIPRAIGVKITELSESYSQQLTKLIKEAQNLWEDKVNLYGTEIEGGFAKSKITAERFERAINNIEKEFANLRMKSRNVMLNAWKTLESAMVDDGPAEGKFRDMNRKYGGDVKWDVNKNEWEFSPAPLILLPLLKGKDVYKNSYAALESVLNVRRNKYNSSERHNKAMTKTKKTTIEMLYQVQPKHGMSVFSDHAGFVCKYEFEGKPPLYIYYHSLEHGQEHTNRRAAWNYGSQSYLGLPVRNNEKTSKKAQRRTIQEPRLAYVENLRVQLSYLSELAEEERDILIIIGECTSTIDERVREFLKDLTDINGASGEANHKKTSPNVKNAKLTYLKNYDFECINASKKSWGVHGWGTGKGVHALVGYMLRHKGERDVEVTAKMVTLGSDVKQNFISVVARGRDWEEKHAFTHLLNGCEDELAKELNRCRYVSVGGDLNNLTCGKDLVETWDREARQMSIGSNSTGRKMYDRISIIDRISPVKKCILAGSRGRKRRRT